MLCVRCSHTVSPRADRCPRCFALQPSRPDLDVSIASDPAFPVAVAFADETPPPSIAPRRGSSTGARLVAWTIDLAVLSGLAGLHVAIAAWLVGPVALAPRGIGSPDYWFDLLLSRELRLAWACLWACLGLAYSWAFAALGGRTPGMSLAGLRLITARGRPPTPGRALARGAFAIFSAALGLFGFALALVDQRGQTLHEKLSGTLVVAD